MIFPLNFTGEIRLISVEKIIFCSTFVLYFVGIRGGELNPVYEHHQRPILCFITLYNAKKAIKMVHPGIGNRMVINHCSLFDSIIPGGSRLFKFNMYNNDRFAFQIFGFNVFLQSSGCEFSFIIRVCFCMELIFD